MAQNITILGASYSDVPAVTLPKTGGGTAKFIEETELKHLYVSSSAPSSSDGSVGDYWIQTA